MIYKGNNPLILDVKGTNNSIRRMYRGNNVIYASNPQTFPIASGGDIYYNGDYAIHVIVSNQSFTPAVRGHYEVFLVGQGGSGGTGTSTIGGGGGAGGVITLSTLELFAQSYGVIVGGTGSGPATTFTTLLSAAGGEAGDIDGDGFGGDYVGYPQNYNGGVESGGAGSGSGPNYAGGGAGAGGNGEDGGETADSGDGGAGYFLDWLDGVNVSATLGPDWSNIFAAGGGGGNNPAVGAGTGGSGIGGDGSDSVGGENGKDYTGSGGGGPVSDSYTPGTGGSGICLVRYRYQY